MGPVAPGLQCGPEWTRTYDRDSHIAVMRQLRLGHVMCMAQAEVFLVAL